jgi:hypothetical protein
VKKEDLLKMLRADLSGWQADCRQVARYGHGWNYTKGGVDACLALIEKVKALPAESEEK